MPVYNGNNEITEIYAGGQAIGEIYNGSQPVYSSGLPVWKFDGTYGKNSPCYIYLLGSYDTEGICSYVPTGFYESEQVEITRIDGTLGDSGSKVIIRSEGYDFAVSYSNTKVVNNKELYEYSAAGMVGTTLIVYKGSVVGDYAFRSATPFVNPSTITASSITYSKSGYTTATGAKDDSYHKRFSKKGVR